MRHFWIPAFAGMTTPRLPAIRNRHKPALVKQIMVGYARRLRTSSVRPY